MFGIPDSESNDWFTSSHACCLEHSHSELVVAIGLRVSRILQDSELCCEVKTAVKSHIARQQ